VTHTPGPEFYGKCLELFKEVVPELSRVAVLLDTGSVNDRYLNAQQAVAQALGWTLLQIHVNTLDELKAAFGTITRERPDGLFVSPPFILGKHENLILAFTAANRLPTMFQVTSSVENGGLMSYYTDWNELRRRAATYVDKILKGATPSDLPVEQPMKLELAINLKTAHALGLTISPSILLLADTVIR
jgi:putative ABC transport system substrate-binding protein